MISAPRSAKEGAGGGDTAKLRAALSKIADQGKIEDADGDEFTNFEEIRFGTFPGNGNDDSKPVMKLEASAKSDTVYIPKETDKTAVVTVTNSSANTILVRDVGVTGTAPSVNNVVCTDNVDIDFEQQKPFSCKIPAPSVGAGIVDYTFTPKGKSLGGADIQTVPDDKKAEIKAILLSLDIQGDNTFLIASGNDVVLKVKVKNDGAETLEVEELTATDDTVQAACVSVWTPIGELAPNAESQEFSCTLANVTANLDFTIAVTGTVPANTRATGVDADDARITVEKDFEIAVRSAGVSIETVDLPDSVVAGETLSYGVKVQNVSNEATPLALTDVQMTSQSGTCTPPTIPDLPQASDPFEFTCESTVPATGVTALEDVLTVTATTDPDAVAVKDSAEVNVAVEERNPELTFTVAVANAEQLRAAAPASNHRPILKWQVANSGNVPLQNVTVDDPQSGACDAVIPLLAPQAEHGDECEVSGNIALINGQFLLPYVLTVSATDRVVGTCCGQESRTNAVLDPLRLYLPLVAHRFGGSADLTVKSIEVRPAGVRVVMQNNGPGAVPPGTSFWVDLYIDPPAAPSRVNQTALDFGADGLVWGVELSDSLGPAETLRLTIDDTHFKRKSSRFPHSDLPAGIRIYAQVDSANRDTDFGSVLEVHERHGGAYNNIAMIELTETIDPSSWPSISGSAVETLAMDLPARLEVTE